MITRELTESTAALVELTDEQADKLRLVGRSLASQTQWWGADEDVDVSMRSVLRCRRVAGAQHEVKVSDAIGVIGLGEMQLIIRPKIPLPHLLYLLTESIPRPLFERSTLDADDDFVDVIARWFVHASEVLLRHGLVNDYGRITGDLTCARGRIHTVKTFQSVVLAGRPVIRCEYDRFGEDTSLNRVLKAAVARLLTLASLPRDLRQRLRRINHRLSDVGELRHADLRAKPDALSRRYRDAHPLALLILNSAGISMQQGNLPTWTFLFRTPEAVEAGVREALRQHLEPRWQVKKSSRSLRGDRNRSLNPDLIFGNDAAVGDVKYRLARDGEIKRAELNQAVTFATGYNATKATVIAFGPPDTGEEVFVGPVRVNGFNWNIEATPEWAAAALAQRVLSWLTLSERV